jgi:hypothetical protein
MFLLKFLNFQQALENNPRPMQSTKWNYKTCFQKQLDYFLEIENSKKKLLTTQPTKSGQKMIQTQKMMHMKCMYLCIVDSKTHYAKHERKQWGGK